MKKEIKQYKAPEETKITIIGDIMLDHYVIGNVERISPEAPVPIIEVTDENYTLGGCGNVVKNLKSVGCKVSCICRIGNDKDGLKISKLLDDIGVEEKQVIVDKNYKTIRKTRMISKEGNQLLRVDREINNYRSEYNFEIPESDIIIVSDYAKGMITSNLMNKLKKSKIKIFVDPKPINSTLYNDTFIITPNVKEFNMMKPYPKVNYTLKTLGENGILLWNHLNNKQYEVKSNKIKVYNVSGCGDTVIAIVALTFAMGLKMIDCVKIANSCAGIVATKPGTASVTKSEFDNILTNH